MDDRNAAGPPRLLPMLAGGTGLPADHGNHLLEPKWDGIRVMATADHGRVSLTNRTGGDVTAAYPELAVGDPALRARAVILDGEVVALDGAGRPDFQLLQSRMHVRAPSARLLSEVPVQFLAFDLLWADARLLVDRPQAERRRALDTLGLQGPNWQTTPVLEAPPQQLLDACRKAGIEGLMAKRLDAPYLPGRRSTAWSKIKCGRRREFVVGGWSTGKGRWAGSVGSLALGYHETAPGGGTGPASRLHYAGQVGSGLTAATARDLRALFSEIASDESPFVSPLPKALGLHFVLPVLVVEVAYTEVTRAGTLRQPSLKGLRSDLVATHVVFDGRD